MVVDLRKYQSKSITPVDEYVCTLSEELQKIAKENLGETPEVRDKALRDFREWIWNNPRIEKCRMDSIFILKFLRMAHFSMPTAKEVFERYLVFREGIYGHDWFTNIDTERLGIQDYLNNGLYVFLPNKAKTGEKVILSRSQGFDANVKNAGNVLFSFMTMVMEVYTEDEENQIRGFKILIDFSGVRLSHYFIFNFSTWFRLMKHVERTFTARSKGFYIINLSSTLTFIVKLLFKHMSERLRGLVMFPSSHEDIDFIDRENLPTEYGGTQSLEKMIEEMKQKVNSRRDLFLSYSKMKINREYYTDAVLKCDSETLRHRLENRKGKLLKMYSENDDLEAANAEAK